MDQTGDHDAQASLTIFVIAGEPSGDLLGARLMKAVKKKTGAKVNFIGIGGPRMEAEGLTSLFPMSELSVMGFAEVVPRAFGLLQRMSSTARAIRSMKPDILVTIDAPSFCFGVLRRLRKTLIKKVHYVAPTVWAWRPGRARKIAPLLDHLMVLLPFEPPYFEAVGLPTTFVGHSILESAVQNADGARFKRTYSVADEGPLLCLLLGSRRNEVKIHLPVFAETAARLYEAFPSLKIVVPTVLMVADDVRTHVSTWPMEVTVVNSDQDKYDAMAASNVALAVSGTVSLELALSSVPAVIAYRVHPLTAFIVRRLATGKYANLVNWLLDREAVPEFLQEECRAELLAEAVSRLLTDRGAADQQRAAAASAISMLAPPTEGTPSDAAASVVLDLAQKTPG